MMETVGVIIAALLALGSAIYTARAARNSNADTERVADAASQREFQIELLNTLSNEVDKLNTRINDLRARLTAAEDDLDKERSLRRELTAACEQLKDQVERLQGLLALAQKAPAGSQLLQTAIENLPGTSPSA